MCGERDAVVIGLTGQSGAGKTTVCEVFEENGFDAINADLISREVTTPGSPCLRELAEAYGEGIIRCDGGLDRRALGDIVFRDEEMLKRLNAIAYPYIIYEILKRIREMTARGSRYLLLDAPTLFESRAVEFCDMVISVTATEKKRADRIRERDGLNEEQIRRRFSSQRSERFFVSRSDYVIKNNKSVELLKKTAKAASLKIKDYYDSPAGGS
jgi:dephospho-CoA kinase